MALSDDEQRVLDEIERELQRDDREFPESVTHHDHRRRRLVAAGAVMTLGLVIVLTGLVLGRGSFEVGVITGIVGLLTMTGAAALAIRPGRHR